MKTKIMKNVSFIMAITCLAFTTQTSIYDVQFQKLNGGNVNVSQFSNKKIIVIAFSAANPDGARLHYLDSLQTADTTLQVIGVPATDFSGQGNNGVLNALSNSLSSKFVMSKQSLVKKIAGNNQHSLFKWLTQVTENGHFDADVVSDGQLFLISNTGSLYSVLENGAPNNILTQVLNQPVN
jgi:glutathione peroxidase